MVMQRVSTRASSSSSALAISVGDATSCSPVKVAWDASSGKGPWTLTIAPINQVPISISIPSASGSNFQYSWNAPNYSSKANTQAFIAVADSTGEYSGVSSLLSIGPSTQNCAAAPDGLDFVWYPTDTTGLPEECTDWSITWEKEAKNNGIGGQVTFTFLPEKDQPITVSSGKGGTSKGGNFKYTVPWASGTKFAVIANDQGQSGTGGVGDLYTVAAAGKGAPSSCSASGNLGNGLPQALTTASAATTSTNPSTSTAGGKKVNSSPTSGKVSSATNNSNNAADSTIEKNNSGHSHAGAAVGATFGILAVIAMVAGLLWYLKKRNAQNGNNRFEKSGGLDGFGHPISPWRFSSSPYDAPVTTTRTSKWFSKAGRSTPTRGFQELGGRSQHGASNSISTSFKGPFTSAHHRQPSSFSQAASESQRSPSAQSPTGTLPQSPFGAPSFRNVVPDDALFPPPRPLMYETANGPKTPESERLGTPMGGLGAGVGTYDSMARQDPPFNSPIEDEQQSSSVVSSVRKKPVGSKREFEKLSTPAPTMANNDYIGPIGPTKTSIYDPYTHLSQIWEDRDGVTQEIQRAEHRDDVAPHSSAITSEVMMQDTSYNNSFKTSSGGKSESDRYSHQSEEALPYL